MSSDLDQYSWFHLSVYMAGQERTKVCELLRKRLDDERYSARNIDEDLKKVLDCQLRVYNYCIYCFICIYTVPECSCVTS